LVQRIITSSDESPPPIRKLLRDVLDLPLIWTAPLLPMVRGKQVGQGVPVIVIPGLTSSDRSTDRLVRSLNGAGFSACGWGQGINMGLRPGMLSGLEGLLTEASDLHAAKVVLVGWSLGGIFAREVAKLHPDRVRLVVTLGSPISGNRKSNNAWRIYEALNTHTVENPPIDSDLSQKPAVPTIALWSKRDGIVATASAQGKPHETDESIEINSTHMGMTTRARTISEIIRVLAERLAEQER